MPEMHSFTRGSRALWTSCTLPCKVACGKIVGAVQVTSVSRNPVDSSSAACSGSCTLRVSRVLKWGIAGHQCELQPHGHLLCSQQQRGPQHQDLEP